MMDVPHELAERVKSRILKDMRPRPLTIYLKSGLAVVIGGALSLIVCGQFGVGVTHAAMHFNNQLHHHAHDHASALMCGIAFALIPPFILRLLCSPLQYRVVVRKPHVALLWFVGLGFILAHHGDVAIEIMEFGLWSVASIVTFQIVSLVIDRFASRLAVPWLSQSG